MPAYTVEKETLATVFSDMFPKLRFAGAAGRFLDKCPGSPIEKQLKERRITEVNLFSILTSESLVEGKDKNLHIRLNDTDTFDEWAQTIGCEIGHTFHYNLTQNPPQNNLLPQEISYVDDFCNEFAEVWLKVNDPACVRQYIETKVRYRS